MKVSFEEETVPEPSSRRWSGAARRGGQSLKEGQEKGREERRGDKRNGRDALRR